MTMTMMTRLHCCLLLAFIILGFLWVNSKDVIQFDDDYNYPYPLTKQYLRTIPKKEESEKVILELENGAYEGAYVKLVEYAKQCITSYNFTLFCKRGREPSNTCDRYDGYKKFLQDPSKSGLVSIISKHKVNPEEFTERFLARLRSGFPDSIITYGGIKDCCPYYTISWK